MLPFESGSETLSREIASQLVSVKGSQKTRLTVIPFSQVLRNHVDTPEKALSTLGATHVLHGTIQTTNDKRIVRGYLLDVRSSGRIQGI